MQVPKRARPRFVKSSAISSSFRHKNQPQGRLEVEVTQFDPEGPLIECFCRKNADMECVETAGIGNTGPKATTTVYTSLDLRAAPVLTTMVKRHNIVPSQSL